MNYGQIITWGPAQDFHLPVFMGPRYASFIFQSKQNKQSVRRSNTVPSTSVTASYLNSYKVIKVFYLIKSFKLVFEMEEVNPEMNDCDLCIVLGANDIVNPSALEDENSPIAGMPVIEGEKWAFNLWLRERE